MCRSYKKFLPSGLKSDSIRYRSRIKEEIRSYITHIRDPQGSSLDSYFSRRNYQAKLAKMLALSLKTESKNINLSSRKERNDGDCP